MKEITCIISGKVQMVMFRDFVQRKARGLDLSGTVQNLENGTVKVIAQGSEENLEKFIEHLHKGPFLARVMNVSVEWGEPIEKLSGFKIVY